MKKNLFFVLILAVSSLFVFSSCEKKPDPDPKVEVTVGVYVLNNGNFESNDACLSFYDTELKSTASNVFYTVNGKKLGDTAQDIIVFGTKMYIAVYNSQVIFVTDHKGKILKEITVAGDNGNLSPRYFTSYGDKVYVTYYEGYLGEIDTTSYSVRKVAVGPNPDQVTASNGKLYVANSGGLAFPVYNNTVSVVSASSFTVAKTLEVVINPQYIKTDSQGNVFLISTGNYGDIPCTLQKIDPSTDAVTTIDGLNPSLMDIAPDSNNLYVICSTYDANWNLTCNYYVYDTATGKYTDFITDGTDVQNAYSISVDPIGNKLYIGTSDYISTGDMYVFSLDGKLDDTFDTGGLNPIKVYPITEMQ